MVHLEHFSIEEQVVTYGCSIIAFRHFWVIVQLNLRGKNNAWRKARKEEVSNWKGYFGLTSLELLSPVQLTFSLTLIGKQATAMASLEPAINRPLVSFTEYPKMSASLVELRVDYHLNRIMKSYRLNNFANAIKALPLQSRICEKLIEILASCPLYCW